MDGREVVDILGSSGVVDRIGRVGAGTRITTPRPSGSRDVPAASAAAR
jgi:hypothetical protein